jgi:hypothetical protein
LTLDNGMAPIDLMADNDGVGRLRLNAEERALIESRRAAIKQAKANQALTLKALKVASQYAIWLNKHRQSDSFSTFVNSFGYQEPNGHAMHIIVAELLKVAAKTGQ